MSRNLWVYAQAGLPSRYLVVLGHRSYRTPYGAFTSNINKAEIYHLTQDKEEYLRDITSDERVKGICLLSTFGTSSIEETLDCYPFQLLENEVEPYLNELEYAINPCDAC